MEDKEIMPEFIMSEEKFLNLLRGDYQSKNKNPSNGLKSIRNSANEAS